VPGNVIIIENAKEEHATEKSLDQTTKQFKVKQREGTNNWIIVMRICADMTLSVIRNHYEVHDRLTAEKYTVLMHKHIFQEEDWNIAKLGMLHNIHVAHVLKDTVTSRIRATLVDKYPTPEATTPFEVYPTFIQCDTTNGKIRTQAYEVQCRHQDSKKIGRMLEKELLMTPYYYKKKDPKTFE
jgi:hypothetical protein